MRAIILIPAAGSGSRMGAAVNKQYLQLTDRPILAHTLSLFDSHPSVDRIYLISPIQEISYCRNEVIERYGFSKVRGIVPGGAERQDSVLNGLRACEAGKEDIVVIHDGVRPLFPSSHLNSVIKVAGEHGACAVGVPVKDTVKEVEDGWILGTPQRKRLWLAQTPQAFRYELIRQAHEEAAQEGFRGTDDASLVERLGHPVIMMEGSYRNIKITTPEDLLMAQAFLGAEKEADP